MPRFTGYCRGCNQDFAVDDQDRCPQCGEALTVAADRPTIELLETVAGVARAAGDVSPTDFANQLLGTQLSLYTIESLLGRGGMAWVFQARHNMLQRPCAVKVLSPDLQRRTPAAVDMFLREARLAASLVHPHVVTVHNVGEAAGFCFIELEYVPGQSLQKLLTARGSLPPFEATGYLLQSCSALAIAHEQGMVHRDYKPANVLVREDGWTKLADFGLAKRVQRVGSTAQQGLSGTPYFMAPELFCGASGSRASDVYAVGITYYYLLTGRFPFTHRHVAQLAHLHQHAPVPDPRRLVEDLPEAAVTLIQRALAKAPADRYQDGAELQAELQQISTSLRSLPSIVQEAIAGLSASLQADQEVLEVLVSLPNGRRQKVLIAESQSQPWSTTVVRVYSVCGPATPSYYQRALELNAQVPHGALAVETIDGRPTFVMLNSHLRTACDAQQIRHSILDIANYADDVEHALTGKDQY